MLSKFEKGVPLLEQELIDGGLTRGSIDSLVKTGELIKYDLVEGVYYINEPISFLDFVNDTVLTPSVVIEKIYMGINFEFGFYYSDSLLNKFGFSTQVPNVLSIISIKVDKIKEFELDSMKFIIYPFNKEFKENYNRGSLYRYIITLVENNYMEYLDISYDDYLLKKKEWNVI